MRGHYFFNTVLCTGFFSTNEVWKTTIPDKIFGTEQRNQVKLDRTQCVKSVRIWSFSGPYFPALRMNTEWYGISLCILSECGKIRTRISPNRTRSTQWQEKFDIYFCVLFDCCCQSLISGRKTGHQIWEFPTVSLFPKILSLKSFGNSYSKFVTLISRLVLLMLIRTCTKTL